MPRKRRAGRGICPDCGRNIAVNSGYPGPHPVLDNHGPLKARCPGSGQRPQPTEPREETR